MRWSRASIIKSSAILVAVAVLIGGTAWARERGQVDPDTIAAASVASSSSLGVKLTEAPGVEPVNAAPLQPVIDKLRDQSQPVAIAVVGDSTSNDENEWLYYSLGDLSTTHGRAIAARVWNGAILDYGRSWSWPGSGAPVTVWNGSAPGKGITYALEHFDAMLPEQQPDLVILNHGHNVRGAIAGEANQFVDAMTTKWGSVPAFLVTLQNPRIDDKMGEQDTRVRNLRLWAENRDVEVIDAHSLFKAHPDPAVLLHPDPAVLLHSDRLHTSPEGARLWAGAVGDKLGF